MVKTPSLGYICSPVCFHLSLNMVRRFLRRWLLALQVWIFEDGRFLKDWANADGVGNVDRKA